MSALFGEYKGVHRFGYRVVLRTLVNCVVHIGIGLHHLEDQYISLTIRLAWKKD